MRRQVWTAVALAALGVLVTSAEVLADQPSISFGADADARPLEVIGLYPQLSNVPLVDARYPHAQADISSPDQARARASTLDPGALVDTGPSAAGQVGVPLPPLPQYPFVATAGPGTPSASGNVAGRQVGPLWVGGGSYDAQAQPQSAQAHAEGAAIKLSALPGGIAIGAGSATSSTSAGGSRVVAAVHQDLQDVTLLGAIKVAKIDSVAQATAVAGQPGEAQGQTSLSGISVLGQAATIDAGGIHLLGQTVPLPQLPIPSPPPVALPSLPAVPPVPGLPVQPPGIGPAPAGSAPPAQESPAQRWLDSLRVLGITIRLATESKVQDQGQAGYQATALEVSQRLSDGTTATVRLGGLAVQAIAQPEQAIGQGSLFSSGRSALGGAGGLPVSSAHPTGSSSKGPSAGARPQPGPLSVLVGLPLTPRGLLLGLLGLFDLALLIAIVTLLMPRRPRPPGATLVGL